MYVLTNLNYQNISTQTDDLYFLELCVGSNVVSYILLGSGTQRVFKADN